MEGYYEVYQNFTRTGTARQGFRCHHAGMRLRDPAQERQVRRRCKVHPRHLQPRSEQASDCRDLQRRLRRAS